MQHVQKKWRRTGEVGRTDLLYGDNLLGIVVHGLVDRAKAPAAKLF